LGEPDVCDDLHSQIDKLLICLGLKADANQLHQLSAYVGELELWNPTYKLIAVENRQELLLRHIADSLAPMSIIAEQLEVLDNPSAADVGSGNGLPGIPLAIMNPQLRLSLIERSGRRAGFLRNVLAVCALRERVEVIDHDIREVDRKFGLLLFRAFRPLPDIIGDLEKLLEHGGIMCAYKSRQTTLDDEIASVERLFPCRFNFSQLPYDLPGLDAHRRIAVITRTS
jgi:16S rRNA (guanine527-N7)-methyltransferase